MEDTQIIALFFARAESAIEALSAKYGRLCYGIAYRILGNHHDAEECENDTYLRVWNRVPPDRPHSLQAYVSRIVRNVSLDRVRYLGRQKRAGRMEVLLSELSQCIPSSDHVERAADDTVIHTVEVFLRTLEPQDRILFVKRYFYLETIESLAKSYGLNASSLSSRLLRIRSRLRTYLEQEGICL